MSIDATLTEIHYSIQTCIMEQKLSSFAEQMILLEPQFILGESKLFQYNAQKHTLSLSPVFQNLLVLLVELDQLDPEALRVKSLDELNAILQKPQGFRGGLLRKEGTERYQLKDSLQLQEHCELFNLLFLDLGFLTPKSANIPMTVDHCMIFGAYVERMEKRICETINYLNNNLEVSGQIFLLGSGRKLMPEEIKKLQYRLQGLDEKQQIHWEQVFNKPDQATEANAFICLWKCLAPLEIQKQYNAKLVSIKSTRLGTSYNGNQGHRTTLEVTVEDWLPYYEDQTPQTLFALVEFPYLRLLDQLRFTILTNERKASQKQLIQRLKNTNFNFIVVPADTTPGITIVLDEISRNVYRIANTLNHIN